AAPSAARPRGGVRGNHPGHRHQPGAGRCRRSAGAHGSLMSQSTIAAPAAGEQEAGWRDVAAVIGVRVLHRLQLIAAAVRPLGWMLLALTLVFWITGAVLGWRELLVAASVLGIIVVICAAFLIGRTAYDVSLDLARTRVVVG